MLPSKVFKRNRQVYQIISKLDGLVGPSKSVPLSLTAIAFLAWLGSRHVSSHVAIVVIAVVSMTEDLLTKFASVFCWHMMQRTTSHREKGCIFQWWDRVIWRIPRPLLITDHSWSPQHQTYRTQWCTSSVHDSSQSTAHVDRKRERYIYNLRKLSHRYFPPLFTCHDLENR